MEHQTRHLTDDKMNKIKGAVATILDALGADTNKQDISQTPERVARMYDELFEGMRFTNQEIAKEFGCCFDAPSDCATSNGDSSALVSMTDIDAFSFCEHHLALMYNMKVNVAYIPRKKIIGLSKIPRIVDMVTKRLQLQERIGNDIAEILTMILDTEDVMVVILGEHSCLTSRGIKKPGAVTKTICARGVFKIDNAKRNEFLLQIK